MKKEDYYKEIIGFFGLAYGCFFCALINNVIFSIVLGISATLIAFHSYFKMKNSKE